jgi:magnesium transporter
MTNEFVLLPGSLSVADALRSIRALEEQPEFVDYLYVAEEGTEHVIGVASLRNVVFCPDRTLPLSQVMESDIISVHPLTSAKEAAALLTTYGLRALPVIDEEANMLGIIIFDDALYVLLPDDLQERIGRLFSYHRRSVARRRPETNQPEESGNEGKQ